MLETADGLPKPGEAFEVEGCTFSVQSMRGRRVALLRVTAPEPAAEGDGEADAKGEGE